MQGPRSTSVLFWAPEKTGVRRPILISSPFVWGPLRMQWLRSISALMFGRAPKQPLRMTCKMMLQRRLIYVHCAVKSTLRQNVVNVICIIVLNVLTRTLWGEDCLLNSLACSI